MRPPFWQRVKRWMCRHVGHSESTKNKVVYCRRCNVLIRVEGFMKGGA